MKSRLTVAQIGVGYWGPNLLRNLVNNDQCDVKLAVDLSAERRTFVKSLYPSIKVSGDSDEIFSDPGIDAVIIKPVTSVYRGVLPDLVRTSVHNFLNNIKNHGMRPIYRKAIPGIIIYNSMNNTKLKKGLELIPSISLKEGISDLIINNS